MGASEGQLSLLLVIPHFEILNKQDNKEITLTGELDNLIINKKESTITSLVITTSKKFYKKQIIKPVLFYLTLLCGNKKNDNNITSNNFINNYKFIIIVFCKEETKKFELHTTVKEAKDYLKKQNVEVRE